MADQTEMKRLIAANLRAYALQIERDTASHEQVVRNLLKTVKYIKQLGR